MANYMGAIVMNMHISMYYYKIEGTESLQKTWKLLENRGNYISQEFIQKRNAVNSMIIPNYHYE